MLFSDAEHGKLIQVQPTSVSLLVRAYLVEKGPKVEESEQDGWHHAILHDIGPVRKREQAHAVTQILEAIYTSSATGKAVEFQAASGQRASTKATTS